MVDLSTFLQEPKTVGEGECIRRTDATVTELTDKVGQLERFIATQLGINQKIMDTLNQHHLRILDVEHAEEKVSSIILPGRQH